MYFRGCQQDNNFSQKKKKKKVRLYQGLHLIVTDKNSCQAPNLQLLRV